MFIYSSIETNILIYNFHSGRRLLFSPVFAQRTALMATLQTARQNSAFTAKSRLKQVVRDRTEQPLGSPHNGPSEHIVETVVAFNASANNAQASTTANRYQDRLSDLEQRKLLLHTVTVYEGWHLVSVQNRPESDVLVAYLVRNRDQGDPNETIREGRAMQIIMDAVGDMKVQHPRRKARTSWTRWLSKLTTAFNH